MTMKLRFEPDLDFQIQTVEAVCDLFRGQEVCRTEFTVTRDAGDLAFQETGLGIGNRLTLLDDQLFKNLKSIQLRNGVPPSGDLESGDFTVEMETGNGNREDLRLPAHDLRAEQALRIHKVRDRGAVGGDQGGRL